MQGIYIIDERGRHTRPPSKVAIKRHLAAHGPAAVYIESTSVFGNEYGGPLSAAPAAPIVFVGPDPYKSRKFYGTLSAAVTRDSRGAMVWVVK